MGQNTWNLQWLNHNSQRSYPLSDSGHKRDVTGTITIPDSFILALYFPIHAGTVADPSRFYLQTLSVFPTGYTLAIGYDDGTGSPPLAATVNIPKSTHAEYRSYALAGVDSFDDSVGKVVIGKLDGIEDLPAGAYQFIPAATPLEVDAIRPMIRGISSIAVVNGSDRSDRYTGDIELVADTNMRITVSHVGDGTPQILFSAINGEGLNEACICDEEGIGPGIKYINGIPPLPDGNFKMVGDDCLQITPILNGLQLSDNCSKPCCGCEALDALTRQIDRFADGAATLQTFVNNLNAAVTQMSTVVLGSRLNDGGCISC